MSRVRNSYFLFHRSTSCLENQRHPTECQRSTLPTQKILKHGEEGHKRTRRPSQIINTKKAKLRTTAGTRERVNSKMRLGSGLGTKKNQCAGSAKTISSIQGSLTYSGLVATLASFDRMILAHSYLACPDSCFNSC